MEIVNTNRNSTMDAIKALAILLVVFGHSIQYISGTDFWNNRVFQIIYSVHMPLFFMLSGFFFVGQENKTIQEFLTRKCMTLLLPCMAWSTLSGLGSLVMGGDIGSFVLKVVNPIGWPFWFLKGLFVVQVVAWGSLWLARRFIRHHYVVWAAVISMVVYLIPYADVARVMLPIFWGGWLLRQKYDWIRAHAGWMAMLSGAVYVVLLLFWNSEGMRFYAGTDLDIYKYSSDMSQWLMDWGLLVYRIVLGLTGSVSIICLFHLLRNVPRWVQLVGTSTEAIYILQACILEHLIGGFIMQKTDWFLSIQQLPSFVLMGIVLPIIAIMLVLLCMWLYQLTRYLPIVARILLGGVPVKI